MDEINGLKQLTSLTINFANFGDDDFRNFSDLESLEFLDLEGTDVKQNPLSWASTRSSLIHLDLSGTAVTDEDLKVAPVCEKLNLISFESCNVGSSAVKYVCSLPAITDVYLGETDISDADLELFANNKTIISLDIRNTKATGKGLAVLAKMNQLESLTVSGLSIEDDDLKPLRDLDLVSLDLSDTHVSASSLRMLARMELNELYLQGCEISEASVNEFATQNPDCTIYVDEAFIE